MKLKTTLRKTATVTLVTGITVLAGQQVLAATRPLPVRPLLTTSLNEEEKPLKKTKTKAADKTFMKLNNDAVKIYPDPIKRDMHVVAKDNDGKAIDFFVFDVEGTLVQNLKMQPKEHEKLTGLKRGTYVYRVFSGDEETASGKFEIR